MVTERDVRQESYENYGLFDSRQLVCLDCKAGTVLWRKTAAHRFHNLGLAMGGGLFFAVDSIPSTALQDPPRSAPPGAGDATVQALDLRTGKAVWSQKISYPPEVLRWAGDFAQFSAETGKILWEKKRIGQAPVILHGKTFLSGDGEDHGGRGTVHDLLTGERIGDFPFRVDGCNYIIGSRHLIMARNATAAYADIEAKKNYNLRNIRSGCSNSLPAADGLLNAPNYAFGCVCNYPIQTSFAMVYMPEVAGWSGTEPLTVTAAAVRPAAAAKAGKGL